MGYHLPLVPGFGEPCSHCLGAFAVLLRADADAVKLARPGGKLAEKSGKPLFSKVRGKPLHERVQAVRDSLVLKGEKRAPMPSTAAPAPM